MKHTWLTIILITLGLAAQASAGNLVENGGFEQPDPDKPEKPLAWQLPDGLGVQWVEAGAEQGRIIRINTSIPEKDMNAQWKNKGIDRFLIPEPAGNPIAATYGLSYYSAPIPVEKGVTYRVSFDFMGKGDGAKVWVRGYGLYRGELRRRYETYVNPRGGQADAWRHFSQEFTPTRHRPGVTEMRVMLYAYWPPGIYRFDNIRIEALPEESAQTTDKNQSQPIDKAPRS